MAARRYGKVFDGLEVTDSLPIPRLTGAFAATENMTFGAPASNSPSGISSTIEIDRMAGKEVLRAAWIPSGQIHGRAVLKGMANRVQQIGLNPKRVAGSTGPGAQPGWHGDCLAGCPLSHDSAGRVRVGSIELLGYRRTAWRCFPCASRSLKVNRQGIAIEIDLEFVHAFRMLV